MKPFNLEAALRGEPCVTRNGEKAWVIGLAPKELPKVLPLAGYILYDGGIHGFQDWEKDGHCVASLKTDFDLVGMWESPTPMRHINGHKFPEPCSEPFKDGQSYFAVSLEAGAEVSHYRWYDDNHDNRRLNSGLIHATQEAAQAHADAINSLFRGEPCPD